MVNHSDESVETVHYNLYDYDEEKWAAGLRWDAHLRSIFFGETARRVCQFRPRRPTHAGPLAIRGACRRERLPSQG